jgi:hypothetical protein
LTAHPKLDPVSSYQFVLLRQIFLRQIIASCPLS